MNQYVLCYAQPAASPWPKVLLIEKRRPAWQFGRYNLPGGHVEEGETIHDAASRELEEEANLRSTQVHIMGTIEGQDFIVYVCRCDFDPDTCARSMTDECVFWMPLIEALNHEKLIDNLRLVIPFCHTGLLGWHIVSERDGIFIITNQKSHYEKTNVSEPLFFGPVG